MQFPRVLAILASLPPLCASSWSVTRSPHFEVFTDAAQETGRTFAVSLERLRAFFAGYAGINPPGTVRVICFASRSGFDAYRIRPGSAGFSLHTANRDYIAVPVSDPRAIAHEYAHLVIDASKWVAPEWLAEGIAEVASTVRVGERFTLMGGDLPGRSTFLKTARWLSPAELFHPSPLNSGGAVREQLFYAQSWALAEMLMASAAYSDGFRSLLAMLAQGSSSEAALEGVYHRSVETIFRNLQDRQSKGPTPTPLPGMADASTLVSISPVSPLAAQIMLADLRHASGDLVQAEAAYRALASEQPSSAEVHGALGLIALERRNPARAIEEWGRALALGIGDAELCFRYAEVADDRGAPAASVRTALERAVALSPQFDAAHFRLAMMDKNEGNAESAVKHLRKMQKPSSARAWVYYTTLADVLLDLGRRDDAREAAIEAGHYAASDAERSRASLLVWLADTVVTVEIAGNAQGQPQFRAVRVPVKAASRNPFFEATDDARTVDGTLEEVKCLGQALRVLVSTAGGRLDLSVPDPSRVQIRNAGGVKFEFVCGPQKSRPVVVDYAAPATLRGLELKDIPRY